MTTFLIYESRYADLKDLLDGKYSGGVTTGEILWFRSFICHLKDRGCDVVLCGDLNIFLKGHQECISNNKSYFLIMDFLTIPHAIGFLGKSIEKIYCMCYWGRDENSIKQLGSFNGASINLKNVLTPFL